MMTMTAFAKPDWPKDMGIQAEAGIVMDVDSGAVIFGQNIHGKYIPASITKVLTALIVIENCDLNDTVVYSETAMNSVEADSGNKLSLVAGDSMTVEDSLHALLLLSVNQSANALAEHTAGSMADFVDMMNEKLTELGCTESHFDNPSGLNGDTQYVSAYDMAKIASAAYSNETMLRISSTLKYKLPPTINNPEGITISHEHRLLYTEDPESQYYYPEATAGKTGYLLKAGNTLVTYAEKDDRRLVSVVLKGQPKQYFVDGKELLKFGFSRFKNVEPAQYEGRYVTGEGTIELLGTAYSPDELMVEEGRMITLPATASFEDADLTLEELPQNHPANAVGLLKYSYNDRQIGEAFLLEKDSSVTTGAPGTQETENAENETTESESPADSPSGSENPDADIPRDNRGISLDLKVLVPVAGILLFGGLAAGAVFFVRRRRKQEAEAIARRRAERRRRLLADGNSAEFERLLEARRGGNGQKESHDAASWKKEED